MANQENHEKSHLKVAFSTFPTPASAHATGRNWGRNAKRCLLGSVAGRSGGGGGSSLGSVGSGIGSSVRSIASSAGGMAHGSASGRGGVTSGGSYVSHSGTGGSRSGIGGSADGSRCGIGRSVSGRGGGFGSGRSRLFLLAASHEGCRSCNQGSQQKRFVHFNSPWSIKGIDSPESIKTPGK